MKRIEIIERIETTERELKSLTSKLKRKLDRTGRKARAHVGRVSDDADSKIAMEFIRETKHASVAHFQRHLGWSYNHAKAIMEILEKKGVVGHAVGSRDREVFVECDGNVKKNSTRE